MAIEKQQGAERLGLRRRADLAIARQMGEEGVDLGLRHLAGMPLAVKQDVAANPVDISLLGAQRAVADTQGAPDLIQQPWFLHGGLGRR